MFDRNACLTNATLTDPTCFLPLMMQIHAPVGVVDLLQTINWLEA